MSDLAAEVMHAVLVVFTVVGNAARIFLLVFFVWLIIVKKKERETVDSVLEDHDDETTE